MSRIGIQRRRKDEWTTVLFYLCGSDLESKYSYASANLEEIRSVVIPEDLPTAMARYGLAEDVQELKKPGTVNVVIQTGGCKEWHTDKLGMDISAEKLQRWKFKAAPANDDGGSDSEFEMVEEAPLASMADPETLTDFIRWGVQKYPAKKYALILWDHGAAPRPDCSSMNCMTAISCTSMS